MVKKKKGGKKGKGKIGEDKKVKGGPSEKSVLQSEIRKLEREFRKYETLKESLEQQKKRGEALYESELQDKEAIVAHLKRELVQESKKAQGVNDRSNKILAEHAPHKSSIEKEITQLKDEFTTMKHSLTEKKNLIVGKLSMLEELRLQKDGIMMKLEQAEQKAVDEKEKYHVKLRGVDKKHILERQRLNEEYVDKVEELFHEFDTYRADELSDMIKDALRKCLNMTEQLDKVSSSALVEHQCQLQLREYEELLKFEVNLDRDMGGGFSSKIEEQQRVVQYLLKEYGEKEVQLKAIDDKSWELVVNRLKLLKDELIKLKTKLMDIKSQKKEQEWYLKTTEEAASNLQKKNSQLIFKIETAEKTIKRELATEPDEYGTRNKLLEQFEVLMNLRTSVEHNGNNILKITSEHTYTVNTRN